MLISWIYRILFKKLQYIWNPELLACTFHSLIYWGEYLLSFALCSKQPRVFLTLLKSGADLLAKDLNGNNILHIMVIRDSKVRRESQCLYALASFSLACPTVFERNFASNRLMSRSISCLLVCLKSALVPSLQATLTGEKITC